MVTVPSDPQSPPQTTVGELAVIETAPVFRGYVSVQVRVPAPQTLPVSKVIIPVLAPAPNFVTVRIGFGVTVTVTLLPPFVALTEEIPVMKNARRINKNIFMVFIYKL